MKNIRRIIISGGYGNFGKRIAELLACQSDIELLIAGRNISRAQSMVKYLYQSQPTAKISAIALDINNPELSLILKHLNATLLIHTSGPFQGQDYRVATACLSAGCHYIDLADDRRFVCDFNQLNNKAIEKKLLLISGASSVPGLSSTIIEEFRHEFSALQSVDISIAPGNKSERGEATIRGILSYTGKSFTTFSKGKWKKVYGWMSPAMTQFGNPVGNRWGANVNVPDLEIFPDYYAISQRVSFKAGLELKTLHFIMVAMGWLVKYKIVSNWAPLTKLISRTSNAFKRLGTDTGGMQVCLKGVNHQNKPLEIIWTLLAENNTGPYIPTFASCILAEKLINNQIKKFGAKACLGLFSLEEFDKYARPSGIHHKTVIKNG